MTGPASRGSSPELRVLRSRLRAIDDRARGAGPRSTALLASQPLTATQVRARLEPGTLLLLVLFVGTTRTLVFAVGGPAMAGPVAEMVVMPRPAAVFAKDITAFRTLVQTSTTSIDAISERGLGLFDALIGPVSKTAMPPAGCSSSRTVPCSACLSRR